MKTIVTLFLLFFTTSLFAQAADTMKPKYGWDHNIVVGLTLTQVSYTDWATGGDNSLAFTGSIIGKSVKDEPYTNWANSYKFQYGEASLSKQGLRKTDDIIDLESIFSYKVHTVVNPYVSANFKTQFARGYEYTDSTTTAISDFLDPGYAREAVGLTFAITHGVKSRVGAALRETFTSKYARWADDPATPEIEKTKIEGGIEWVTEAEIEVDSNILFKSKLETFGPFKTFDKWKIYNDNILSAKVSKLISVIFNVTLAYDEFIVSRTQIKESLALGINYQLF
jgi:hypothetical protein